MLKISLRVPAPGMVSRRDVCYAERGSSKNLQYIYGTSQLDGVQDWLGN